MSSGALSGVTAGLVFMLLAVALPSEARTPPAPPGPPRPASRRVVIAPAPDSAGRYLLRQQRAHTLFTDTGLHLRLAPPERPARELGWGVAGARAVPPQPLEPREARFHQLVGPRESWKQNLPTWGALYYPGVAPGVDLWFQAREGGVEYSLRAERGAELRQVRLEWRGAQELRLAEGGRALEVKLADGELREEGLLCGQERADGSSFEVPCRYRDVRSKGAELWEYVIEVDVRDPEHPAWVDPVIRWNTFVGATGNDSAEGLTVLDNGEVFLVGSSGSDVRSSVEPRLTGRRFGNPGLSDVVVTRFDPQGTLRWQTVMGGIKDDFGKVFVIGDQGYTYVAGTTASLDFRQPASGSTLSGLTDGFVARLKSDGSELSWVQHVGGTGTDDIHSMVLGPDGKLYVAGGSSSPQLTGSDAGVSKGKRDLFVSRLDGLTGVVERTLVRSGSGDEEALGIVAAPSLGRNGALLYVTGYTASPDFPPAAVQPVGPTEKDGGTDTVVLRLNQDLSEPEWGTFIGGQGEDKSHGLVHVPDAGTLMVVGTTRSPDFPHSLSSIRPSGTNAFVARFNESGVATFSAVMGGSGDDEGLAITPGTFGSFYIGGRTRSLSLPALEGPMRAPTASDSEGFVIRMGVEQAGLTPEWSTFVGGSEDDEVRALASGVGAGDTRLFIGGRTSSEEMLPLPGGGDQPASKGAEEMFLIVLEALDLTAPVGIVNDGAIFGDRNRQDATTVLQANWEFKEPETSPVQYQVAVGTAPGCADIRGFQPTSNVSLDWSSGAGNIPELARGTWYFVTVEAKNAAGLSARVSSNGFFVNFADGGPPDPQVPPPPPPGPPCPGDVPDGGADAGVPDAGVPDAGGPDAGVPPGPEEGDSEDRAPLGWSCGAAGGPAGLALLVLLTVGLLTARRKPWKLTGAARAAPAPPGPARARGAASSSPCPRGSAAPARSPGS